MVSEILSRQAWYVSPWRYESSTYITELWSRLLKCPNGTLDILVKTFVAGGYPFGMHVNWNKSSNVNLSYSWWAGCIGTEKNASLKSMDAIYTLGLMMLRNYWWIPFWNVYSWQTY